MKMITHLPSRKKIKSGNQALPTNLTEIRLFFHKNLQAFQHHAVSEHWGLGPEETLVVRVVRVIEKELF